MWAVSNGDVSFIKVLYSCMFQLLRAFVTTAPFLYWCVRFPPPCGSSAPGQQRWSEKSFSDMRARCQFQYSAIFMRNLAKRSTLLLFTELLPVTPTLRFSPLLKSAKWACLATDVNRKFRWSYITFQIVFRASHCKQRQLPQSSRQLAYPTLELVSKTRVCSWLLNSRWAENPLGVTFMRMTSSRHPRAWSWTPLTILESADESESTSVASLSVGSAISDTALSSRLFPSSTSIFIAFKIMFASATCVYALTSSTNSKKCQCLPS